MPSLYPIRKPDGSGGFESYRYGTRDHIGVEADGATEQRGFNEALAWLRRVGTTVGIEHNANGVHTTKKIARAFIKATWDGSAFATDEDSYLLGTSGSSVATVAVISTGILEITLSSALAGTNITVEGCAIGVSSNNISGTIVRIQLDSVTSTTKFRVRRYEGDEPATLALTTGSIALAVHGAA